MNDSDVLQSDLGKMLRALGLPDGASPESPHEKFLDCIKAVQQLKRDYATLSVALVRACALSLEARETLDKIGSMTAESCRPEKDIVCARDIQR